MLKCYICDEKNKTEEAVSICIVCGMGLCMEHARRADLEIWEGHYPMPVKTMDKKTCPGSYASIASKQHILQLIKNEGDLNGCQ